MSKEIKYDKASDTEVIRGHPEEASSAEHRALETPVDAQLAQPVQLIHAGNTGADDDRVETH